MHVLAHSSEREISDSEGDASKVGIQKRKKRTHTHFRKYWKGSFPRTEEFGDLITAEHKVLNEGIEPQNNHRYAVVVQDLAIQWIQSYPCKTQTSQETEKNLRKFLEKSQKPKVTYTNDSLEFGKPCDELSWNHRTATPHRAETSKNCRTSCTSSKRRDISGIVAIWIEWKVVVGFHGMQLLSAKCPKPLGRREISIWKEIWGVIQRTNYTNWRIGWISPNSESNKAIIHQFRKKLFRRIIIGHALIAEGIWEEDMLITDIEEVEHLDSSEKIRRLNAKEVMITRKDEAFIFLLADGSAKLSGRDYEFQESTLRRESTIRRENLSGEFHGDREEFQPEETKDDAKSSQRLLVYSRRFQLSSSYWTESSVICAERRIISYSTELHWCSQSYIHNSGCVAQETGIYDSWDVDENRNLSDPWTGSTRFILLNERSPDGYTWSGRDSQRNKRSQDTTM